jgi:hypothetical protein
VETMFLQTGNCARFIRTTVVAAVLAPLFAIALPAPADAQTEAPPGGIIISRDVPTRRAYLPGEPGQVNAVETVPTQTILDATDHAMVPLTDAQIASVTAGRPSGLTSVGSTINDALTVAGGLAANGANGRQGVSLSTNPLGQGISGSINSSIGAGTNALQGALSSIGSVLSGGD